MGETILDRYDRTFSVDREFARRARSLFPDGVTHDSRRMDPFPVYIESAAGSHKRGVGGRDLIDYWAGHGALLLGHNPQPVVEAVTRQIARGTHYGASHPLELEWVDLIRELVPCAQRVRFVNSGTEATLMAVRLARIFTGKAKVLKFAGHFHWWHDAVIPAARFPLDEGVSGIPQAVLDATIVCPPNDIDAVAHHLHGDGDIACVILEPTGGMFGTFPMNREFVEPLRQLTAEHGVVLIFDEVVTGFRVAPGGAQGLYGITPDLATLAKILGGGLPCGAVVGRSEIMDHLSADRQRESPQAKKMPHPGTFNANPLSAAAGIAMLKIAAGGWAQQRINAAAARLREGLADLFDRRGLDWAVYGEHSAVKLLLGHGLRDVSAAQFDPYQCDFHRLAGGDPNLARHLRCALLLAGVDMPVSGGLLMAEHSDEDIDHTLASFVQAIGWMEDDGFV